MDREKLSSAHVEGFHDPQLSTDAKVLLADAEESVEFEHNLTARQAIQAYPMAVFWCLVVSTCVIMEGYDQILVQSLFAYPTFQRKYGKFVGVSDTTSSGYQLTAAWQAGLNNGSTVGSFFGTLLNGYEYIVPSIYSAALFGRFQLTNALSSTDISSTDTDIERFSCPLLYPCVPSYSLLSLRPTQLSS